jgi:hypothetical protein
VNWLRYPAPESVPSLLPPKLDPLTGLVVRFNIFLMKRSAQGDLIVKVAGQERFVRLIYCPYDCGFDAPAAMDSQVLPRKMIQVGHIPWTYGVHPPQTNWEKGRCSSIDRIAREVGPQKYVFSDGSSLYTPIAGQPSLEAPPLNSLSCFVIGSWSEAQKSAQ